VPRTILIDEIHIDMHVPKGLPDAEYQAIRHVVNDRRFRAALRRAVRAVVGRHLALGKVRLTLSR
jgi:hypothetical protein